MNDNNHKWELTLFQILRVRGNVNYLIDSKHTYTDILLRINKFIEKGLVKKIDDSFVLTGNGQNYYHQLCRSLGKRGLYKYFMDSNDNKTTSISTEDIYIPRRRFKL